MLLPAPVSTFIVLSSFLCDLFKGSSKNTKKKSRKHRFIVSIHISAVPSVYVGVTGGLKGRAGKLYNLGPHSICLGCCYKYTS